MLVRNFNIVFIRNFNNIFMLHKRPRTPRENTYVRPVGIKKIRKKGFLSKYRSTLWDKTSACRARTREASFLGVDGLAIKNLNCV